MNFRSNVLAMLTGTMLAQAIPLLASPFLSRLFTPEAFGLQTLFMGIAGATGVLATCRLDLALVLPDTDQEASSVAFLAMLITVIVSVSGLLLVAIAAPELAKLSGHSQRISWLWMLPVMTVCIALVQLSIAFASRERNFRQVAKANITNQTFYAVIALSIGSIGAWTQGLALAKLAGQVCALGMLGKSLVRHLSKTFQETSFASMRAAAVKYRQFFFFNTPYSLAGSIARDAPIYIFSAASALASAGFYGLARTIVMAPTLLVSNALSQVFYREAISLRGTPHLEELTVGLLRFGLLGTAPLFAFCAIWGDVFFRAVFGPNWEQAGMFTMVLAPAAWMSIQTGWPERLFEAHMRQDVSFKVQVGMDVVTAMITALTFISTKNAVLAVAAFTITNLLYHHIYLAAICHIATFSKRNFAKTVWFGWLVFGGICTCLFLLRIVFGNGLVVGGFALCISCLMAGLIAKQLLPNAFSVSK